MTDTRTRRDVLRLGARSVAGAAVAATAGSSLSSWFRQAAGLYDPLPSSYSLAGAGADVDPAFHLLSRAAYGPRPGDVERVRALGRREWIEEQLAPERIEDDALTVRLASCELAQGLPHDLHSVEERFIDEHITRDALVRAVHSNRQLLEVMTGFWRDHFSIDAGKRGCMQEKPLDDRSVLRQHALGRFRDLVTASALSPAMIIYLDGRENVLKSPTDQPNENYARELLELHTLSVHGGYSQTDVMEAARCLTGWTLHKARPVFGLTFSKRRARDFENLVREGQAVFRPEFHDDGEKVVLGERIPAGGGASDLEHLIRIACSHPSTARYVATKLCRRFVADPAPESLVASTTDVFTRTDGDLREIMRHILTSDTFERSVASKLKRPLRFVASSLRALGVSTSAGPREIDFLERLGHLPHHYPTPDGYPEEPGPWLGTLLWRWNFALALSTRQLGPTKVDLAELAERGGFDPATTSPAELAPLLYGRLASDAERGLIDEYVGTATGKDRRVLREEAVALLVAGPTFQLH